MTVTMKELLEQCASVLAAGFAAACCLGVASVLAVLSAVGAGFLIRDVILIPLYLLFLGLSAWLLYRSTRAHGDLTPFRAGLGGLVAAFVGLWISPVLVYAGLAVLIAGNLWDFRNGRKAQASAP